MNVLDLTYTEPFYAAEARFVNATSNPTTDQKTVNASQNSFLKSFWSQIRLTNRFASLGRYLGRAIPKFSSASLTIARLGLFTSSVGVINGALSLKQGALELESSKKLSDSEGVFLAKAKIVSSTSHFSCSTLMLGGLITDAVNASGPIGSALSLSGNLLMGAGSVLGMGLSAFRIGQLAKFRLQLNCLEKEDNPLNLSNKIIELFGLTEDEVEKIAMRIQDENPDLQDDKSALFVKKMSEAIQVKLNFVQRRTSKKAVQQILDQAETILAELKDTEKAPLAIKKVNELIKTMKKDNCKKTFYHICGFIAAALAFSAFIVGTVFSFGTLPFILLVIASFIGLGTTFVDWIMGKIEKRGEAAPLATPDVSLCPES